jgi:DNA-binding response OmpR family regulator
VTATALKILDTSVAPTIQQQIDALNDEAEQLKKKAERLLAMTADGQAGLKLILRPDAFTVENNGRTCRLGRRPYTVLRRLIDARGVYVDLSDCYTRRVGPSTIRTAIHRIKAKLATAGMEDIAARIHTNRARAYAFRLL